MYLYPFLQLESFYLISLCNSNDHNVFIFIFDDKHDTRIIKLKMGMMYKYEVSDTYDLIPI